MVVLFCFTSKISKGKKQNHLPEYVYGGWAFCSSEIYLTVGFYHCCSYKYYKLLEYRLIFFTLLMNTFFQQWNMYVRLLNLMVLNCQTLGLLRFETGEDYVAFRNNAFQPHRVCKPAALDLVLVCPSTCSVEPSTGLLRDPGGYMWF